MLLKTIAPALLALLALLHTPLAQAQASCSSDGQPQPVALYERFINADCETCWASAPAHAPGPSALVVDWLVPGSLGDDAPLSAAATRDALWRLQSLGRPVPAQTDTHVSDVAAAHARLRVAAGPVVQDYVGTGIRLAARPGTYQFTLLLVESLPAGAEGSPVARNLVRNSLQGIWNKRNQLSKGEHFNWMENRSMRVPDGARAERLRMVGWAQDDTGRVVAAAQSTCR